MYSMMLPPYNPLKTSIRCVDTLEIFYLLADSYFIRQALTIEAAGIRHQHVIVKRSSSDRYSMPVIIHGPKHNSGIIVVGSSAKYNLYDEAPVLMILVAGSQHPVIAKKA